MVKGLVIKVKNILDLQGRTLPNALHLMVVAHQTEAYDFDRLLQFILKGREVGLDSKSLDVIESRTFSI